MCNTATIQVRIRQKKHPGGSSGQTGSRNMAATCFSDLAIPASYFSKSRPKYTTTSSFANPLQVWPRRLSTRVFRITINFTTFRTISGTFDSTFSFWTVLPGYRFGFGAHGFLIESISSRLCVIRRQYRPRFRFCTPSVLIESISSLPWAIRRQCRPE